MELQRLGHAGMLLVVAWASTFSKDSAANNSILDEGKGVQSKLRG